MVNLAGLRSKNLTQSFDRNLPLPIEETMAAIVHKMTLILPIACDGIGINSFLKHLTVTNLCFETDPQQTTTSLHLSMERPQIWNFGVTSGM